MDSASTSYPSRFAGLDTLRAIATAMVMLYHFGLQDFIPQGLTSVASVGWIGVDLFLVLSGFLIGSQLIKPGKMLSFGDCYSRRAYRILPHLQSSCCSTSRSQSGERRRDLTLLGNT